MLASQAQNTCKIPPGSSYSDGLRAIARSLRRTASLPQCGANDLCPRVLLIPFPGHPSVPRSLRSCSLQGSHLLPSLHLPTPQGSPLLLCASCSAFRCSLGWWPPMLPAGGLLPKTLGGTQGGELMPAVWTVSDVESPGYQQAGSVYKFQGG